MAPPPRELMEDAVGEILLRIPPDDPARLVRASAVSRAWRRILAGPAFSASYRAFHGTPHVLGFLRNPDDLKLDRFVPTTSFRPSAAAGHRSRYVFDCRHGRALLYDFVSNEFVVWDPITGDERRVPDEVPDLHSNFAVLCAAAGEGCDHSGCSGGPFLLARVGVQHQYFQLFAAHASSYSSETGARSAQTTANLIQGSGVMESPAAFVGGALHFDCNSNILLRYDVMGDRGLSVIKLPDSKHLGSNVVMATEDGELGLASLYHDRLCLWSREAGSGWAQRRVIHLRTLLPITYFSSRAYLSAFAEGANVIFLNTDKDGIFTIHLESLLTTKVCSTAKADIGIPYVSFYTPAACTKGTLKSHEGAR
ncbi:hypothetical protein EJB05_07157, partial [Eragrostis curvula]